MSAKPKSRFSAQESVFGVTTRDSPIFVARSSQKYFRACRASKNIFGTPFRTRRMAYSLVFEEFSRTFIAHHLSNTDQSQSIFHRGLASSRTGAWVRLNSNPQHGSICRARSSAHRSNRRFEAGIDSISPLFSIATKHVRISCAF